jgi:hypothetical protein
MARKLVPAKSKKSPPLNLSYDELNPVPQKLPLAKAPKGASLSRSNDIIPPFPLTKFEYQRFVEEKRKEGLSPDDIRDLVRRMLEESGRRMVTTSRDLKFVSKFARSEPNIGDERIAAENNLVEKRAVRKGVTLRKAFERPRPDLPADAPVNRMRKQVALTLPLDLIEELNSYVAAEDMDRSRFIEAAIREALRPKPA